MGIVEEAALAVCRVRGEDPNGAVISFPDGRVEVPINIARGTVRAVIQALREPSEGMLKRGHEYDSEGGYDTSCHTPEGASYDTNAHRIWQAMIDAALEE